ncbi:4388_t:CDS:1 [Acaulospora morrowiae]|uniref:4388_t:CDS:1 n=1 Tax=Acaulospora morrowiae TaxID=94023 RepID=A0A9N9AF26_9GLOM|nr:4388_t:CDS:1 [Acaulospora morrowiae]
MSAKRLLTTVLSGQTEASFSPPPLVRKLRKKDYKKLLTAEFRKENERRREESLRRKAQGKKEMNKGQDLLDPKVSKTGATHSILPTRMRDRLPKSTLRPTPVKKVKDPSEERIIFVDGTKKTVPIINQPKASKSYRYNDMKRYRDELKLRRYEFKLELGLAASRDSDKRSKVNSGETASSFNNDDLDSTVINRSTDSQTSDDTTISKAPEDLLRNQRMLHEKMRAEREARFKKIKETSEILSLTSSQPFTPEGYKDRKKEIGLDKYEAYQSMKRQDRLNYLINLYHSASDFVTLNNLDERIEEAFNKKRIYANTLDDMRINYKEMGGVGIEEVEKRLTQISDILEGTSRGRPGLDVIKSFDPSIKLIEVETKEDNEVQSIEIHESTTNSSLEEEGMDK